MGLRPHQMRVLPTDDHWRLRPGTVTAAARADRGAGLVPFAVCASAGSTNTGAVHPLAALADVCAADGLWLHVDAAYGGFAALTPQGRALLAGIERADLVTVDPHGWLLQPLDCGGVLLRDGARLTCCDIAEYALIQPMRSGSHTTRRSSVTARCAFTP